MIPSTENWAQIPGGWDALHALETYTDAEPFLGMPLVDSGPITSWPTTVYPVNSSKLATPEDAVHCFVDDYRFERIWNNPARYTTRLAKLKMVLSPDFSVYSDMPLVMQMWQVYRQRWTCKKLQAGGVTCVPVVSWGDVRSFGFSFLGIAPGSVVAVTSVGRKRQRAEWDAGMRHGLTMIMPETVVVIGPEVDWLEDMCPVKCYESTALGMMKTRLTKADKQLTIEGV